MTVTKKPRRTKRSCGPKLKAWINELGTSEVSRLLGVESSGVRHWRNGIALPGARHMRKIVKLTKGRVSYADMIDGHFGK